MDYDSKDYTFWGLFKDGTPFDTPISTLAYLVALVEGPTNAIVDLDKAKYVLRFLFDVEEQVKSASELVSVQEKYFPKRFFPQTPVMLTVRWSPISALLEQGSVPSVLKRESKGMACASGIWRIHAIKEFEVSKKLDTPEELFWHILKKVIEKAKSRGQFLSITAMPGWSYESSLDCPRNLSLEEAQIADRVIWQRTPR